MTLGDGLPTVAPDGTAWLSRTGPAVLLCPPQIVVGDDGVGPLDWGPPRTTVSDGEVEVERATTGGLRFVVRHHVAGGRWTVRATLTATEPATEPASGPAITVGPGLLRLSPGSGHAWAWAAGSQGLVVLVDDPARPLSLWLRRGRLDRQAASYEWLAAGTALTRPAVVELSGSRSGWRTVADQLPAWLPTLALPAGDELRLPLPDDAVTATGMKAGGDTGAGPVLRGSGSQPVSVRGVTGDLTLVADFAPPLARLVDEAAARATSAPVGPVAAAARLVVLGAAGRVDDDAYDVAAAALLEAIGEQGTDGLDPLVAIALARLAAVDPAPWVLAPLGEALAQVDPSWAVLAVTASVAATLGSAAADVVLAATPTVASAPVDAVALCARLGMGLPGDPVPDDPVSTARTVAALTIAPQPSLDLPCAPDQVAELASRRLLARFGADERVLAWLLVAAPFR